MSRYTRSVCIILDNGQWMAQAVNEIAAMQVLNALQDMEEATRLGPHPSEMGDPLRFKQTSFPQFHIRTVQQDEYACSCGLRWDVSEDDPHATT